MRTNVGRVAVATLVAAMLAGVGARADAAISTAQWCAAVPAGQSGFTDIGDVEANNRREIECLAAAGITRGTNAAGTLYSPTADVKRNAMATFVAGLVEVANRHESVTLAALPASAPDRFTDDTGDVHEGNINRLAASGIVRGKTATTYDPQGLVNRGQMATFLVEALEYMLGSDLPAGTNAFTDDAGNAHEANINKLAGIDVVDGTSDTTYSPNSNISRAQMAAFLVRSLAWLHSQNKISALQPTRQTIVMSPVGPVTNGTDSDANADNVTFTASNISAGDVDIRLFPCEAIAGNNPLRYADASPNDGIADPMEAQVVADILSVNGAAQPANTIFVSGAPVSNGSVTFVIDSPSVDCVAATVWDDADDDNGLDLDAQDKPLERFGAAAAQFEPPASPTASMDENVLSNDEVNNVFVGCEINQQGPGAGSGPELDVSQTDCWRFTYDGNDVFRIDVNANGQADDPTVSQQAFEDALSPGDDVSGSYDSDSGDQSVFLLIDEAPSTTSGVSASGVDHDTITVTFNEVAGADEYRVYFNADPGPPTSPVCPSFTTTGADPYRLGATATSAGDGDADTTVSVQVHGLDNGTRYCFSVTVVDERDESVGTSQSPQNPQPFASTTNTGPRARDTELAHNQGSNSELDNGDFIQVCFDDSLEDFTDAGAETVTVTSGSTSVTLRGATVGLNLKNAEFSRGAGANPPEGSPSNNGIEVGAPFNNPCSTDRVLTIQITALTDPISLSGLRVTASGEVEDATGLAWDPAAGGDQDLTVDAESGDEPN